MSNPNTFTPYKKKKATKRIHMTDFWLRVGSKYSHKRLARPWVDTPSRKTMMKKYHNHHRKGVRNNVPH